MYIPDAYVWRHTVTSTPSCASYMFYIYTHTRCMHYVVSCNISRIFHMLYIPDVHVCVDVYAFIHTVTVTPGGVHTSRRHESCMSLQET